MRHGMGDDDALRIDVTVHQDGEDAILIAVADNGVGMDEGTAARLFDERSARPDASSPQGGGAGVAMHNISERIHRFLGRTPIRVSNRHRARAPKCFFILICQRASLTFKSKIKGCGLNVMRRMPGVVS